MKGSIQNSEMGVRPFDLEQVQGLNPTFMKQLDVQHGKWVAIMDITGVHGVSPLEPRLYLLVGLNTEAW